MKSNNILIALIGAFLFAFASCEPIEDRATLANSFDPNDIELEVMQATTGGNKLSIQMKTKGIIGYWDYLIDTKYTDRVEVVFPYTGEHTFTFHVTTPYMTNGTPEQKEFDVQKSITVNVTQLDEPLPDAYYALVGDDLTGKTWVFDGGPNPDGGFWWYMVSPDNWEEIWWNAAGECCPPGDAVGKMVFNLDGGQNYVYYADAADNSTMVEGSSFSFNGDFTRLTIKGPANILGSMDGGGNAGEFEIIELTSEKMVLYVDKGAWDTGWLWVFKPAS